MAPDKRFLRLPEVVRLTGYRRSMIYALMAQEPPTFPVERRIGPNTVIWLESEVRAWMRRRLGEAVNT